MSEAEVSTRRGIVHGLMVSVRVEGNISNTLFGPVHITDDSASRHEDAVAMAEDLLETLIELTAHIHEKTKPDKAAPSNQFRKFVKDVLTLMAPSTDDLYDTLTEMAGEEAVLAFFLPRITLHTALMEEEDEELSDLEKDDFFALIDLLSKLADAYKEVR